VTDLAGFGRYPQPLAPVAAAEAAGMPLPTREQLLDLISELDRPGRLTLVEGAGGLLVELGEKGVTARDLAAELGAAVLVVVSPSLGTLNHTALTLESLAARNLSCAGLVIGSWPRRPGVVETTNRSALARLSAVRAALPEGAASLGAPEFATLCAQAFDRDWVTTLVG
jgi:dethiobiotin synthetase